MTATGNKAARPMTGGKPVRPMTGGKPVRPMTGGKPVRPITGRKVLVALVAFFGVVIVVNGLFIFLSLDSFPGVETEDAYRKGLAYDRELADGAAQRARGWTVSIAWQAAGPARGHLAVAARGRDGEPIGALAVKVVFRRPIHAGEDREVALVEVGPGIYRADVVLPGPGNWEAVTRLSRAGLPDYVLRERLVVP